MDEYVSERSTKTRLISLLVAIGVLVAFIFIAITIVGNKPEPAKSVVRESYFSVRTIAATIADTQPSVLLVGEVEARDYAALSAPIETEVHRIPYREGQTFAKNAQLIKLDLREQKLQAQSQSASVETAKLQLAALHRNRAADNTRLTQMSRLLELAEQNYARNVTLQKQNLVAQAQIESSEQALAQQQLQFVALQNQVANYDTEELKLQQQLVAAEAALGQISLLIERGEIRAPFAGQVAEVHTSAGARPARGAVLIEIFNPRSARLRAVAPNRYAPVLLNKKAKQSVRALMFIDGLDGATPSLALAHVSPRAESGQGGIEVFFDLPNNRDSSWVLGATYEFELLLPPVTNALSLPIEAVYAESRIYVVDEDSRAQDKQCERLGLSRHNGKAQALLRCPQVREGDAIIATQIPGLAAGAKVRIVGTDNTQAAIQKNNAPNAHSDSNPTQKVAHKTSVNSARTLQTMLQKDLHEGVHKTSQKDLHESVHEGVLKVAQKILQPPSQRASKTASPIATQSADSQHSANR